MAEETKPTESAVKTAELVVEDLPEVPEVLEKLSALQRAFVHYYVASNNGTLAAKRAGYSPRTANEQAVRLLARASIADAIAYVRSVREARIGISADSVIEEYNIIAMSDISHYQVDEEGHIVPTPDAPPGVMRAVKGFKRKKTIREDAEGNVTITYEVELRLWDKPGSLKLLGKYTGVKACFDRVEVTGADGGPIELAAAKLAELPPEQLREKVKQLAEGTNEEDAA